MIGDVKYPLSTALFGPGVYEVVSEINPLSDSILHGVTCHHRTCFSSVPGSGMGHRVYFHPSGGCFHHCMHIVLAVASLRERDIIYLPEFPIVRFYPLSSLPERL